jgi:hypothetical protein
MQLPIQWVSGILSPDVNQQGRRETGHLPSSTAAKVNNSRTKPTLSLAFIILLNKFIMTLLVTYGMCA